ncbi:MAG: hypothetical protein V4683_06610 [Bacteroidota bacterium]
MKKWTFVLVILVFIACQKSISPEPINTLGLWGGSGVQLEVTENNSFFDMDCASANINSKLKTTGNQVVEQFGTYTYEHGGPIAIDEKPDLHPAKFRGKIVNDSMFIFITILDQKRADISLNLKRNSSGLVFKCL